MADFEFTTAMRNTVDMKKIQELAQKQAIILVGFPSGRVHVEAKHDIDDKGKRKGGSKVTQTDDGMDIETADLAAQLHYGSATIPARPFIDEGIEFYRQEINALIEKQLKKEVPDWDRVGSFVAAKIGEFVRSDHYKSKVPNSPQTIEYKGSDTPLIDGGDLIGSLTYQIAGEDK